MTDYQISRRRFIAGTTASSAAIALLPGYQTLAAGRNAKQSANEKLNLGVIGVGGRGRANLSGVAGENIYALCDVNPAPLGTAKRKFPKAKTFTDWRELVQDPGIDGVVISTADHHHALAAIAAMKEGKHVYCEKPLAHTVREARMMQDEYKERRGKIATQMGTQIHAKETYRRVVELIQGGAIGPVTEAHVWCNRVIRAIDQPNLEAQPIPENFNWDVWLGPAANRPYNIGYWKGGNLNWNRRWEFGNGVLGDMGSHLIDLPYWALQLHRPTSVVSEGPKADGVICPSWQETTWQHPAREGNVALSKPVKVVWYHGNEGMKRRSAYLQPLVGADTKINRWSIGVAFIGASGVLVADYGSLVLCPATKFENYKRPKESIPKSIGHHKEWIHAAKTGGESLCNFDYSGALIEHNLLGNVAYRVGKKIEWDAENLRVTNSPEANALLTKEYRDGWGI